MNTGHLLYVHISSISTRMVLALLKLRPEVTVSELIVDCETQNPQQHIDPGMLNMVNICGTEML